MTDTISKTTAYGLFGPAPITIAKTTAYGLFSPPPLQIAKTTAYALFTLPTATTPSTARRSPNLALFEEDEWFTQPSPRRYAPPFVAPTLFPYVPSRVSGLVLALQEEEPWEFKYQRLARGTPLILGKRPILFTVT